MDPWIPFISILFVLLLIVVGFALWLFLAIRAFLRTKQFATGMSLNTATITRISTLLITFGLMLGLTLWTRAYNRTNAFISAASRGNVETVKSWIAKGINLDVNGLHSGMTALSWAARNDRLRVVKLLVASGANIDWQDRFKNTPLMHAVTQDHTNVIAYLLPRSNARLKNSEGLTAYGIAKEYDCTGALALLEQAGLKDDTYKPPPPCSASRKSTPVSNPQPK